MLSPKEYAADCERLVWVVVDHSLKDKAAFQRDQSQASQYWESVYPSEPFMCDLNMSNLPELDSSHSLLPQETFVPCFDIDVIWRTHQLVPGKYAAAMKRIVGNLLNHVDSMCYGNEGSTLHNVHMKTSEHWKSHFNENYVVFGSLYRGMPPNGFLYQMRNEDMEQVSTKKVDITIEKVCLKVEETEAPDSEAANIKVVAYCCAKKTE